MLAQHHGKTAYAISGRSAEPAHRTFGGEHTVIAPPKPSGAPGITASGESQGTFRKYYKVCWLSLRRTQHMRSSRVAQNHHTICLEASIQSLRLRSEQ